MESLTHIFIITAFITASAIAAIIRLIVGEKIKQPFGTLLLNTTGSFALGLFDSITPPLITILGIGFLGTYTTVSTFAKDTVFLIQDKNYFKALLYVLASMILSVMTSLIGLKLNYY